MSYADVNGISLYYEEHGSRQPLVLLHGGLLPASMYAPVLPMLAKDRRVIRWTCRPTGTPRTWTGRCGSRRWRMTSPRSSGTSASVQADVMGFSFGGATALRTAIQHPPLVRRLVVVSVPFRGTAGTPRAWPGWTRWDRTWPRCSSRGRCTRCTPAPRRGCRTGRCSWTRPATCCGSDFDWSADIARSPRGRCWFTRTPTRCARRTSSTSTRGSAAGCATRAGTVRPGPWPGWPYCRATRTTTSSARPTCPPRSSRSSTRPSLEPPAPLGQ